MINVAVLIPCLNEAKTIAQVVDDFKKELPYAKIYVYDNKSNDNTKEIAKEHGAIVKSIDQRGKGNVVQAMFSEIVADYYVLIDGDDTYPVHQAKELLDTAIRYKADMVVGDRLSNKSYNEETKSFFHKLGNKFVNKYASFIYRQKIKDILSGYRVLSKNFVRNCDIKASGFELEVELANQAIKQNMIVKEIPIVYKGRPKGSYSKISTLKDGIKIMYTLTRNGALL